LYVPLENDPLAGKAEAAPSDNVTVILFALNALPTREKTNTFCPVGPTIRASTSLNHV
jgi:hypothetical protein